MDSKNSRCSIHGNDCRHCSHLSVCGVVQRLTSVLAVLVVLFTLFVTPISAEEEPKNNEYNPAFDAWEILPDYQGKDWYKGAWQGYSQKENPETLYAIELGNVGSYEFLLDAWIGKVRPTEDYILYFNIELPVGFYGFYGEGFEGTIYRGSYESIPRVALTYHKLSSYDLIQMTFFGSRVTGSYFSTTVEIIPSYVDGLDPQYSIFDIKSYKRDSNHEVVATYNTFAHGGMIYYSPIENPDYMSFDVYANVDQFLPLFTSNSEQETVFHLKAYADGRYLGYDTGYESGYFYGYDIGYNSAETGYINDKNGLIQFIVAVFTAPAYIINTIFDFDLFGFNVATVIRVLLTLIIVAVITKFALKSFGG